MTARDTGRSRTVLVLLILASVTLITLDGTSGDGSPVAPLRTGAADVFGPAESVVSSAVRPIIDLPGRLSTVGEIQERNDRLESDNARLQAQLETSDLARNRADQLDGLFDVASQHGFHIVPAQVIALGPAQSFGQTVTIDAGTQDGVAADMTVLNDDGLVGRVLSADAFSSTVLLIVDADSVVGGRLASSMELGFLDGDGDLSADGTLSMSLVDKDALPQTGDTVVSWGSRNDAPYVPAVPIGQVLSVRRSPRELSATATVQPYVDFSALDIVGVVVGTDPRAARTQVGNQATGPTAHPSAGPVSAR
jgi:rod shape-determining protein MreC